MSARPATRAAGARAAAGFTVMELLLAMGIIATMTALLWASFAQTLRIKRYTDEAQDRYHTVSLALDRVARDLGMAYLSLNEMPSAMDRRTYFAYQTGMEVRLDFSTLGHQHLYRDAREGDTAIVSYYLAPDPVDRQRLHLMRRESRRLVILPDLKKTMGESYVICPDVVSFKATFFDARQQEWRDDWNTTSADGQPNRLPWRVHVELGVRTDKGQVQVFSTDARLHMDEPIDGRPDRVQ
ncbi:MAG TPA: type II secretion system protein [Polyangia bacterium]